MVRHIVLWRLKSPPSADFALIRQALERQLGRVPGLLRLEVGRAFNEGRRAVDFSLVCDFETREALGAYHRHGAHLETRAIVDPLVAEHWIADYELPDADQHPHGEEVKQQGK
ncbi:MAG: Dabb family protein [Burkholderiales bacterium]